MNNRTYSKWEIYSRSDVANCAKAFYNNPKRHYHNWSHIERMFFHAEHTFSFAFDENLALAILYHDAIYDSLPDKELRSARVFARQAEEWELPDEYILDVVDMIMSTCDHKCYEGADNRLVMLDLANLASEKTALADFKSIFSESKALYPAEKPSKIAANSFKFMENLSEVVKENREDGESKHICFWEDVGRNVNEIKGRYHTMWWNLWHDERVEEDNAGLIKSRSSDVFYR